MTLAIALLMHVASVDGTVTLSNGHPASEAVVYLLGSTHSKPITGALVDQRNRMFIPHISVVTTGTTVSFPNNDTVYHNVFAEYNAKRFDLGQYPHGATRKVTFDKPGVVALLCSIHAEMSAYIMVVDTPYYAVADRGGHFRIPNVPGGSYELRAWHESNQVSEQTIEAGHGPLSIKLHHK